MTVQQRLTTPEALLAAWAATGRSPRRKLLADVIGDVCSGAHSLNELDFARWCRRAGLPAPTRQAVRVLGRGRAYLDAWWEEGVHVEIQGAHHYSGTAGIDDALRFNELGLQEGAMITLQIPVLGLRLAPERFLRQVADALTRASCLKGDSVRGKVRGSAPFL